MRRALLPTGTYDATPVPAKRNEKSAVRLTRPITRETPQLQHPRRRRRARIPAGPRDRAAAAGRRRAGRGGRCRRRRAARGPTGHGLHPRAGQQPRVRPAQPLPDPRTVNHALLRAGLEKSLLEATVHRSGLRRGDGRRRPPSRAAVRGRRGRPRARAGRRAGRVRAAPRSEPPAPALRRLQRQRAVPADRPRQVQAEDARGVGRPGRAVAAAGGAAAARRGLRRHAARVRPRARARRRRRSRRSSPGSAWTTSSRSASTARWIERGWHRDRPRVRRRRATTFRWWRRSVCPCPTPPEFSSSPAGSGLPSRPAWMRRGTVTQNVAPSPGALFTPMEPPRRWASSREIASPRPVPLWVRVTEPSIWRNFSKMTAACPARCRGRGR